jgi:hypothetical protein
VKRSVLVAAGAVAFIAAFLAAASARADESAQGPAYVQGTVGLSFWDFPHVQIFGPVATSYSWTGFNPTIEFGYHFQGRHDGIMLGIRQGFSITALGFNFAPHAAGTTAARIGYDFAFKAGTLEINVDPYVMLGVGYIFDGPSAGIETTGGLDLKLFITKGFYVVARPAELGIQCFHDSGNCAFAYLAGIGAGFAFGN